MGKRNVINRNRAIGNPGLRGRRSGVVVLERSGRHMVEVASTHRPLIDAMRKMQHKVTTMSGHMLGHQDDNQYVCCHCPDRRTAIETVVSLLNQTVENARLRESLGAVGIPNATQLGDKVMVWWPNMTGQSHTIH